jgi:hypothetical protein
MKQLVFKIQSGDKTCASQPGAFCQYVGTKRMGAIFGCTLFQVNLEDENGWLMRCPECLEREVKDD